MPSVDFKDIKSRVSITQAADILKLKLKPEKGKLRGQCPACQGDDRKLVVTPDRGIFYCFTAEEGGSCLDLVMHITGVELREAAEILLPHARSDNGSPQPQADERKARRDEPKKDAPFDPAAFLENLEYSDEVKALGLSEEDAKALGVGWYRGKMYQAARWPDGGIAAYSHVEGGTLKFPKKLVRATPATVVPFKKKA